MYQLLSEIGNQEQVIKNAKALESRYKDTDYATHKPSTAVYRLAEELNNPENVIERINSMSK